MFGLGPWEISLIALALFLLFGRRLPKIAGSLGKSVVSFKKGLEGLQEADPRPDVQKALHQEQPRS
ncbi:MAG: twin-arginine translocase TatA/TatE family subunit [Actinobacteria bacterium]|nr:twin-arginine translocase TatA/TatE family subunit [Actinomycetota bacterium]